MARNTKQFYAIINKNGWNKEEVVLEFTNERTASLSALSDKEFADLMLLLRQHNWVPAGDKQRKKMISLARQMDWGTDAKEIVKALDHWLLKQKFQKPLMKLDLPQLNLMLAVFEQKVYGDYLTALNK